MSAGFIMRSFVSEAGDLPADGDARAEAEAIFPAIEAWLGDHGLDLSGLTKVRFLYSERADFPAMNSVRDPLFRGFYQDLSFPASTGVVTDVAEGPGRRRLVIEATGMAGRRAFNAPGVVEEWAGVRPPFSHGNVSGGIVWVSGQGPYDAEGALTTTEPLGQARDTLAVLERVLAVAGAAPADTLGFVCYLRPEAVPFAAGIAAMLAEWAGGAAFAGPLLIVPITDLAFPGLTIEIDLVARDPALNALVVRSEAGAARAAAHGGLVMAGASGDEAGTLAAALVEALAGLGAAPDGGMLTVWVDDPARVDPALEAIGATPLARAEIKPRLMAPGSATALVLEFWGGR